MSTRRYKLSRDVHKTEVSTRFLNGTGIKPGKLSSFDKPYILYRRKYKDEERPPDLDERINTLTERAQKKLPLFENTLDEPRTMG